MKIIFLFFALTLCFFHSKSINVQIVKSNGGPNGYKLVKGDADKTGVVLLCIDPGNEICTVYVDGKRYGISKQVEKFIEDKIKSGKTSGQEFVPDLNQVITWEGTNMQNVTYTYQDNE